MRTKLSLTIAATLLAGSVTAASAADMPIKAVPPPPVYDWTGWYLGVGFGGLWGDSRQTFDPVAIVGAAVIPGGTVRPEFDQAIVSLHGGHLHQFKNFGWGSVVIGIDQSFSAPLDNSTGTPVVCPNPLFNCGTRIQALMTTGAILGLAWDRVLLSVRGGYAGGLIETRRFVAATGALFDNIKLWHNG
jgi:outer membrane immunogenic protein